MWSPTNVAGPLRSQNHAFPADRLPHVWHPTRRPSLSKAARLAVEAYDSPAGRLSRGRAKDPK